MEGRTVVYISGARKESISKTKLMSFKQTVKIRTLETCMGHNCI
jgi:hypothetical protein